MKNIQPKSIEIFCGTGGVGKTTLSTARGQYLSTLGRKVLLITLDPSQRLKDFLYIKDDEVGILKEVHPNFFAQIIRPENLLLGKGSGFHSNNRILKTLLGPYGGMNEIYGLLEVYHHYSLGNFDTIILDTAPGKHFIDFIKAAEKIRLFFENSFLTFFHNLKEQLDQINNTNTQKTKFYLKPVRAITKIMETGVRKLMEQLEKVTGTSFVHEFIETIDVLYSHRNEFLQALKLRDIIANPHFSNLFLVSAADYQADESSAPFHKSVKSFFHKDSYFILNRTQEKMWEGVQGLEEPWIKIRDSILHKERENIESAKTIFNNLLTFSLLDNEHIDEQLKALEREWEGIES